MLSQTEAETIKCRAAVFYGPRQQLFIEEVEVEPPKAKEVRIKMEAASVCHGDIAMLNGSLEGKTPCILGHEGAGIVESIGHGVFSVQPGDHVLALPFPRCGECKICQHPRGLNCCNSIDTSSGLLLDKSSRFKLNGTTVFHFLLTSTFSEYTVVPEICVAKIDTTISLGKVCFLGCGVAAGYGAALNTADVKRDSKVAVWGLDVAGMAVVLGCRERKAKTIIGIDTNEDKCKVAKQLGCTQIVNPNEYDRPVQECLTQITGGGLDYTFDCSGDVNKMKEAFESTHRGWGVSIVVGLLPAGRKIVGTEQMNLIQGRTWKGSLYGDWDFKHDVPKLVVRYMDGQLPLDSFIRWNVPFKIEELRWAINNVKQGEFLKIIVNFGNNSQKKALHSVRAH